MLANRGAEPEPCRGSATDMLPGKQSGTSALTALEHGRRALKRLVLGVLLVSAALLVTSLILHARRVSRRAAPDLPQLTTNASATADDP